MESKKTKQIVTLLKKSLSNWDLDKAIKYSLDEAQTRDNLIHPFLDILNYQKMDDYSHEFVADTGDKKGKKVDIAIFLGKKLPSIIVECKKATSKLTEINFRQLNEYCLYTPTAKIGILTNGIIYNFYSRSNDNDTILNEKPFFTFDLSNYEASDLDMLALFYKQAIDINQILLEAEEIHFIDNFDDAFFKTLANPSSDLIKIIFKNMGGKRISETIEKQISDLINSISIKNVLDRVITREASESNTGIITTEEEIKAYNVIKTIMAMSSKFKNSDLDRVGYKDFKGSFKILVDGKQTKSICSLVLGQNKKIIEINNVRYELEDLSISSLTKLKKELVQSALDLLN
jgi:predicted type IV restriction endonuclease